GVLDLRDRGRPKFIASLPCRKSLASQPAIGNFAISSRLLTLSCSGRQRLTMTRIRSLGKRGGANADIRQRRFENAGTLGSATTVTVRARSNTGIHSFENTEPKSITTKSKVLCATFNTRRMEEIGSFSQ